MPDITTITAAMSGVKKALEIVKVLRDLDVAQQQAVHFQPASLKGGREWASARFLSL
jgi:hypothetical protein